MSCDHYLRTKVDAGCAEIGERGGGVGGQDADAFDAVEQGVAAGLELGEHASGDDRGFFEFGDLGEREPAHDFAVGALDAGDVGEEDEGVGVGADGAGGGHLVGVDVVVFAVEAEGDGGDDGDGAHLPDGVEPTWVGGGDLADEAEVGVGLFLTCAEDVAVASGEAHGGLADLSERGDEPFVDAAGEDHEGGVAGFGIGDAEAGDELALLAHLGEGAGELDAAAVNDGDLVAIGDEVKDGPGTEVEKLGLFEGGTAEFDDEFHLEALLFVEAVHEIHILDRLAGCALEQVIETADEHKPLAIGSEMEAEIAEAGVRDVLDLGQVSGGMDAHHGTGAIEVAETQFEVYGLLGHGEPEINGRENAARNGEQMRGELDLRGGKRKLLEQLAGVAMAEDGVGREIVCGVHEVGLVGGLLAGAADAAFGVADDAVVEIDEAGAEKRRKREDNGRGVAAGVGNEARRGNLVAMKLRRAVNGLGLEGGGERGIGVGELVDGAVGGVMQAPGTAEIDDLDAAFEPGRSPFPRGFVGQGEKDDVDAGVLDEVPAKRADRGKGLSAPAGELGVKLFKRDAAEGGLVGNAAEEEGRGVLEARMGEEQAGKLASGVAADPGDGGADGAQVSQGIPRFGFSARGPASRPGR